MIFFPVCSIHKLSGACRTPTMQSSKSVGLRIENTAAVLCFTMLPGTWYYTVSVSPPRRVASDNPLRRHAASRARGRRPKRRQHCGPPPYWCHPPRTIRHVVLTLPAACLAPTCKRFGCGRPCYGSLLPLFPVWGRITYNDRLTHFQLIRFLV